MKVKNEDRGMHSEGQAVRTGQYTIQASSKMFKMLSDGVYKDKLLAPIRELLANAMDELRMQGKKGRPPEVTLPTMLSPELRVKDFGRGMDEDTVMELYTTYGYSTKDTLNTTASGEIIGGFGIGSKSPFAYTDTFTIESRHGGTISTYAAHLDNIGMPTIVKVHEAPSDEPSGMTIKMPVMKNDCEKAARKLEYVCEFYEVQPIVKGSATFEVPVQDYTIDRRKDGWALKSGTHHSSDECRIILGGNALPLDLDLLGFGWDRKIRLGNMDIWMEMGTVDVAVSREELSYDDDTISNLQAHLDKVEEALVTELTKDLEKIKNRHERSMALGRASKDSRIISAQSKQLAMKLDCDTRMEFKGTIKIVEHFYNDKSRLKLRKSEGNYYYNYTQGNEHRFVIVDESRACDIKTRQWASKFHEQWKIDNPDTNLPVIIQLSEELWNKIRKEIGYPSPSKYTVRTSTIVHTPLASQRKARGEVTTYNWSQSEGDETLQMTQDDAGTVVDGRYVVINKNNVIINEVEYDKTAIFHCLTQEPSGLYLVYKSALQVLEELEWEEDSKGMLRLLKKSLEAYKERECATNLEDAMRQAKRTDSWGELAGSPYLIRTPYNTGLIDNTKVAVQTLEDLQNDSITTDLGSHSMRWGVRMAEAYVDQVTAILTANNITLDYNNQFTLAQKKLEDSGIMTLDEDWEKLFPLLQHVSTYNKQEQSIVDYINGWTG